MTSLLIVGILIEVLWCSLLILIYAPLRAKDPEHTLLCVLTIHVSFSDRVALSTPSCAPTSVAGALSVCPVIVVPLPFLQSFQESPVYQCFHVWCHTQNHLLDPKAFRSLLDIYRF